MRSGKVINKPFAAMRLLPVCAALLALAACNATQQMPTLPKQDIPSQWSHALQSAPQAPVLDPHSWWRHFHDPLLDRLVEQALANNLSVAQAKARIERARLLLGHSGDEFLPALHARTQAVDTPDATRSYFQYGLDASWELGLFGRGESEQRLAQAAVAEAGADAEAARVAVIAEVVRNYLELRAHQRQLADLQQQRQLLQERLGLLDLRTKLHLPAQADRVQTEQGLSQLLAGETELRRESDAAAQRLALLLGLARPDEDWLAPASLPVLAPFAIAGVPGELLRNRPELHRAESAVLAAAAQLGVARSELYPHVSLGASYLYAVDVTHGFDLNDANHSRLAVAPVIDIPLFDWGQRRAAVSAGEMALNENLLAYRAAVLDAVGESELALSSLQWQQRLLQQATDNLALQQRQVAQVDRKRQLGFASKLDVLTAQQALQQVQQSVLDAQMAESLAFIALYKALGGSALPDEGAR
ncbi:MAG TPA: efflux transporter outer membrane subunit [Candidatus Acidoferrum sp.]|nr:efflux transporter outer membrane subunit [Candidatus Acidoferrum sp.]